MKKSKNKAVNYFDYEETSEDYCMDEQDKLYARFDFSDIEAPLYYEDEKGEHRRRIVECHWCNDGKEYCDCTGGLGPGAADWDCPVCGGHGFHACIVCGGRGWLFEDELD